MGTKYMSANDMFRLKELLIEFYSETFLAPIVADREYDPKSGDPRHSNMLRDLKSVIEIVDRNAVMRESVEQTAKKFIQWRSNDK